MKLTPYLLCFLIVGLSFNSIAQTTVGYRQPANEKAIPKIVLNTFKEQYPNAFLQGWFVTHLTYWVNDYSSGWYSGWYGQRQVVVYTFEKPSFFEVEFINLPGERSRAIYNMYGYWYETRSQIKGLPIAIREALELSKYNGWKVSALKERIENPGWPTDIYRFQVSKGLKSRIIRMDDLGNIIQAKNISE